MLRSSPNEQTVKFRLAGVVRKLTERTWRASRSSKVTRPRFETVVVVSRSAMNRASSSTSPWQGRAQDAAPDSFPAQSCGSYAIRRARDWWHGRAAPAHGGRCRPTAHRSAIHHTVAVRGAGGGLLAVAGCVWACCGSFRGVLIGFDFGRRVRHVSHAVEVAHGLRPEEGAQVDRNIHANRAIAAREGMTSRIAHSIAAMR